MSMPYLKLHFRSDFIVSHLPIYPKGKDKDLLQQLEQLQLSDQHVQPCHFRAKQTFLRIQEIFRFLTSMHRICLGFNCCT